MKALLFKNPVFQDGVTNVTVRRGIKWAVEAKVGDTVSLQEAVNDAGASANAPVPPSKLGVITDIKVMRYIDIAPKDLLMEHDPTCRNTHGLWKAMKAAYPSMTRNEIVTLVFFTVQ